MNGVFCDDCKRWFPGEAGTTHRCLARLVATGHAIVANEDCRWCGKPSREGHPSGVLPGRWKCTDCRGYQDDEFAPEGLQLEEA